VKIMHHPKPSYSRGPLIDSVRSVV